MKRTTIWLQEDHQKKLKALSENTGAPVSALIRKAIDEYLAKKVRMRKSLDSYLKQKG